VTQEELANLVYLRRARDLMDREYARPLDVAALARAALMSTAHFARQFRAAYGESPHAYLMTRRVERAKALLRRGGLPQRRPRRHLREGARLGRRDRAGADRAAVGHAGLRHARPVRQPGAHRPAARRVA